MVSTLIVRDVTLAVNGAPEIRGEAVEHLQDRLEAVSAFTRETVEECVEVLRPSAGGEDSDTEVLGALTILGLAQPETCSELGVLPVRVGRRLAARLESSGESSAAVAVLELLAERFPGNRALERDLAALTRRRGLVGDLVERYIERAQHLLKVGRTSEAIEWLREVMLLDRSRKDVARLIRDLRYQELHQGHDKRWRGRLVLISLGLSLAVSLVVMRELHVRDEYRTLPSAESGDRTSVESRLAAIESFVGRYPVWHRSFSVLEERSRLRVEVERLGERARIEEEQRQAERARRVEAASLARERGLIRAGSGDFETALVEFKRCLELASADWPPRARVERDVEAITAWLENDR